MSHQASYQHNEAYAEFLSNWDPHFYAKYADTLRPSRAGGRVLDVGCGAGQVVDRLNQAGFEAHGVDVSEPNIARARRISERCRLYDGRRLPFAEAYFASAGALNVLEHVDEPEEFVRELVRVVEPGGRVVLSSPNFFRVLGLRDYHPRMRGLKNKWRNWRRLLEKRRQIRAAPDEVRFDRMTPVVKEPFAPDDDAVVATNPLEMRFFLERVGCAVERVSCTDRYVAPPLDFLLNLTPLRYLMFNAFLVARRSDWNARESSGDIRSGSDALPRVRNIPLRDTFTNLFAECVTERMSGTRRSGSLPRKRCGRAARALNEYEMRSFGMIVNRSSHEKGRQQPGKAFLSFDPFGFPSDFELRFSNLLSNLT